MEIVRMPPKKLLITNVVYGEVYSDIFLKYHLGALLDETNIPRVPERVEYTIFTDGETFEKIRSHENFRKLSELIPTHFRNVSWIAGEDRFGERYSKLILAFRESAKQALEGNMYLSAIVADLVCAKHYVTKILKRLDDGHDAVFMHPFRSTMEPMSWALNEISGALSALELFDLGYRNMHPLFSACQWDTPQFTKMPFTLLWNSGTGCMARSFSVTPIAFVPQDHMVSATGVIDVEIPKYFKNPYWCHDWTDAPIMGVEPMQCYYPPFANHRATVEWVRQWALRTVQPHQFEFLNHPLYYPNKEQAGINPEETEWIAKSIIG